MYIEMARVSIKEIALLAQNCGTIKLELAHLHLVNDHRLTNRPGGLPTRY